LATDFSPETIFISYSRSDGRVFAEAFERKLGEEAGIRSWRDLKSIEGGEDIRPQVLRAIEAVKHLVLVLSQRALASDWVKREWTHARMMGRKVSPVLADTTIKRSDLPGWIRRADVYDISQPERWAMLVQVLRGPGETRRVPYMSGDLPEDFVPRPAEYHALKEAVLSMRGGTAVGVTTALRGAGGYGKTTLANYLCRDPEVRFEFTDGILRVEIGKERNDVTGCIVDLVEKLDPNARRPGFQDVETAAEHLGELIGEARLLLVIDDVWREAQLRPFLRGAPNCVRVVTTRLPQVLPKSYKAIDVDEMSAEEATGLVSANLPIAGNPIAQRHLAALAERLGYWAQMLSMANGWIRGRMGQGEGLENAVARFEHRLKKHGLTAFDPKDERERNRAIRACVEASLEDLGADELARFRELAILPEDEDVPLAVVAGLWAESGGSDEDQSEEFVQRFHALSLLQGLDLGGRTLRLHDNMTWYLRESIGAEGRRAAHAAMVRALGAACEGIWATLPASHTYGWRFLIRHLREAGQTREAEGLLTDYAWIKAKFLRRGPHDLFASYIPESEDEGARLIGQAIALSIPALAANPRELPRQLFGRLGSVAHAAAARITAAARADADFHPAPRWPGLTPPGAERLRLGGHEDLVDSAAFSPDGARIVTASRDRTARIWDATMGTEIKVLRGHEQWVESAVFSPDGARIVTTSADRTARIWNATTGTEIKVLRGHEERVASAGFSADGAHIVTASQDRTARIWDATTGTEIRVLRGHEEGVTSAAFSPDGAHIVTASHDGTARTWDAATGTEIKVLRGHRHIVWSAAFAADGARIVTASGDWTARTWDAAAGTEIKVLRGHERDVRSAIFSPDGARIVTASGDRTAVIWDATTGTEIKVLRGHELDVTSAVFSPDGARIVTASSDRTARIWDAAVGPEIKGLGGHEDMVTSAAFSPGGARIVTAGDSTVRIWNATTGRKIKVLRGHEVRVYSAAFSPDGARIVTASWDRTAVIWDATKGRKIRVLRWHEGWPESAVFSPDGACIVTASVGGALQLWDATTGTEIKSFLGTSPAGWNAAFSPDGACIITASGDHTARIWDARTGTEIKVLRGHEDRVMSAAFSPDGASIVTASLDRTARIWNAAAGTQITSLRGHEDSVWSAAFSPDGARIITASRDRTARIWDATAGTEITRIALDASVMALAVHNGDIALGDALGRVHVFEAEEFLRQKGNAS